MGNFANANGAYADGSRQPYVAPLGFESPPVDKQARNYTGYYTSSVRQPVYLQSQEIAQADKEEAQRQQVLQQQEETLLYNYFNNIAEFSKFNDIDMFDATPQPN